MHRLPINLLFLIFLFFLFGCKKDSPSEPEEVPEDIIASANIGTQGGELSSDNVSIIVPSGSFNSNHEMKIIAPSTASPFEGDGITNHYKIDGIPDDYILPIQVKIKLNSSAQHKYIAVGEESFVKSLGESSIEYQLFDASESDGFIICELPAPETNFAKSTNQNSSSINVQGIVGSTPVLSSAGNFRIKAAGTSVTVGQAQTLAGYLENAFTTIQQLGFNYNRRTKWPVEVTLRNMAANTYGYSMNSIWGHNYGYLEFNSRNISRASEMQLTAGHEFFHLVQSLYDPRNAISRAKFEARHYWLDEATAVWIEEKFSSQPNFVSPIRAGNEMAPFDGMHKGAEISGQNHGYGMSAVIKYLVSLHNDETIVSDIYDRISVNDHPVDAIETATDNAILWYEQCLRAMITGQIYNLGTSFWVGQPDDEFRIQDAEDTLKTYTKSYPDLSGRLFKIKLEYQNIDQTASLSFNASGGTNEITIFKYNNSGMQFINTASGSLTLPDVKTLTQEGWNLIVLLTNARAVSPYTETQDITLEIKVDKPEYDECYFQLKIDGNFYRVNSDGTTENVTINVWNVLGFQEGTFSNNIFTASWDEEDSDGLFFKGNLKVTMSEDRSTVISIEASENFGYPESSIAYYDVIFDYKAAEIPFVAEYTYYRVYEIEGTSVSSHITNLDYVYKTAYKTETLQSLVPRSDSKITVEFWKPIEKNSAKKLEVLKLRSMQK